MQVKIQDCGCIALPDEVVVGLGLSAGTVLRLDYSVESRTMTLLAPAGEGVAEVPAFAACAIHLGR